MIQDTVQPRDGIEYAYGGKTYYLCCQGCLATFAKDPARYSRGIDPVNALSVATMGRDERRYRDEASPRAERLHLGWIQPGSGGHARSNDAAGD